MRLCLEAEQINEQDGCCPASQRPIKQTQAGNFSCCGAVPAARTCMVGQPENTSSTRATPHSHGPEVVVWVASHTSTGQDVQDREHKEKDSDCEAQGPQVDWGLLILVKPSPLLQDFLGTALDTLGWRGRTKTSGGWCSVRASRDIKVQDMR